ncbi:formate/nitrite transporter family protein [Paragemmobacter straminiformis]|uniref:Formate/nitrite transporter family protein n=1 Tax=Paragemmobacter straminiformis TaxID=2045119 RepID=A0A842IAQ7_9RHOB|nr:formate/nitrite transporter family protein [Gemmobacter straminiformis]MBC2836676.1 formate/nitrite transporter family protein [Gemmobacter straminiformis]
MTPEPHPLDVVAPARMAKLVEEVGIRKAGLGFVQTLALGVLAGAFIAFGAMFYTVAVTGSELGYGPTRLIGGAAFSLGLILVIIGGAELFTGNSLILLAWASGDITTRALLRNWGIVYCGNLIGAMATAVLVHLAGSLGAADGAVGATADAIAAAKLGLDPFQAFLRAILCNALVCLAVWMCFSAHSVSGKVLVILFPVTAFVTLGFEHSVANMYLIPVGMLHSGVFDAGGLLVNLIVVTAGNVVGGGLLVALVYWLIYLRAPQA